MEGGSRRRNGEFGVLAECLEGLVDVFQGGFFGLVGDGEAGEVSIGGEFAGVAFFEKIFCEIEKISLYGGLDDRVVWLISLDNDFGTVEMSPTDAADDLGKKLKSPLFGGEIGEGKASVGLDDADGSKERQIKPAGESLSTNKDVDFAGFDVIVEFGEAGFFVVVAIKTGDFGFGEEAGEFGFEKFGAETFVNNAGVAATGAASRDFFFVTTDMTDEKKTVSMERHGEVASWTEGLPATFFTDCQG